MNIIPLIVGSLFLTIGINIMLGYSKFKRIGTKIKGRVKAIEKYQSTNTHSGTKSTFYRPIVEYIYKNETEIMIGSIGANEIRHKLNQQLNILIIESDNGDISTRIEDNINYILGIIFSLIGIAAIAVYLFIAGGSLLIASIVAPIILTIGLTINKLAQNSKNFKISIQNMSNKQQSTNATYKDSIIIETKADYLKEISSHSFWGNVIAYSLMFASLGIIYGGYYQLPDTAQDLFANDIGKFFTTITNGTIPSSWKSPLMITGIGIFFFLASIHSALYMRRQYGGASKI